MKAPWPEADPALDDPEAEEQFGRLQAVIIEVRNIRATFRVPAKERVTLFVQGSQGLELLSRESAAIHRLAGLERMECREKIARPEGSVVSHLAARGPFDPWDLFIPLAGLVDLDLERRRIEQELQAVQARMSSKQARLSDPAFRAKAPAEVVAEEEELLKELEAELLRWNESLKQIQSG